MSSLPASFSPTPEQEAVLRGPLPGRAAGKVLGINRHRIDEWRNDHCPDRRRAVNQYDGEDLKPLSAPPPATAPAADPDLAPGTDTKQTWEKDYWTIVSQRSPLASLDEFIAAYHVDTAVWNVDLFEINRHESFAMPKAVGNSDEGWARASTDPIIVPLSNIKARFKKKTAPEIAARAEIRAMIEAMKGYAPHYKTLPYVTKDVGHLLVVSLPDAHFGKLCWHPETGGGNYNTLLAQDIYLETIQRIVSRAERYETIGRVLYILGNDFINADNSLGTTTAGTPQDMDSRYPFVYKVARETAVAAIELLTTLAQTDVLIVPGNHDFDSMYALGDGLQGWMHNNPNCIIDNGANPKKYYRWGVNAFGLVHGNFLKTQDLPLTMSMDNPAWGECWNREWLIGHTHKFRQEEYQGNLVRTLPSLTATDQYHASHNYINNLRRGVGMLYHQEDGYQTEIVTTFRANK